MDVCDSANFGGREIIDEFDTSSTIHTYIYLRSPPRRLDDISGTRNERSRLVHVITSGCHDKHIITRNSEIFTTSEFPYSKISTQPVPNGDKHNLPRRQRDAPRTNQTPWSPRIHNMDDGSFRIRQVDHCLCSGTSITSYGNHGLST